MNTYEIVRNLDGVKVFTYTSSAPVEWQGMEFTTHTHNFISQDQAVYPAVISKPYDSLIDVGAFFDRFGSAKMVILTSSNVVVQAIVKDCSVRKWIDLTRAEVALAVNTLAAILPAITPTIKAVVMQLPVTIDENLAIRKIYFSEVT